MVITKYYSPNFDLKKRSSKSITAIIIHYTGMQSERESLKKLTSFHSKVSCHYLINRTGTVFRLVHDNYVAWHAGKSRWANFKNLNKNSIGIELVNRGHKYGYQSFTKIQLKKLLILCKKLKRKYRIKNQFILGHSDIAPLRKIDPGEKFPWDYLFSKGVGIQPTKLKKSIKYEINLDSGSFFKNLYKIGYRYLNTKLKKKLIKSFQRRFRQRKIDGIIDQETYKISEILAKKSNLA